jgi:hypothetical protein
MEDWGNRRFSLYNTLRFSLAGFREGGWSEAERRFRDMWDQHLHEWIGPWYCHPVARYYSDRGITPAAGLDVAMKGKNRRQLRIYAYAVSKLANIPGIAALLSELASVDRDPREEETHSGERRYHNLLVELHSSCFVHKNLGMKIVDVEYSGHSVLSPNRVGNKSCDIKAERRGEPVYFECKDSSYEIVSQQPFYDAHVTTPKTAEGCAAWLMDRLRDSDDKGADYLIAKIPMWSRYRGRRRDVEWIAKVLPSSRQVNRKLYELPIEGAQFRNVKGVFILQLKSAIEIRLAN